MLLPWVVPLQIPITDKDKMFWLLYLPRDIWTSATILPGLGKVAGMVASLAIAFIILFQMEGRLSGLSVWCTSAAGTVRMMFSVASSAQGTGY